MNGLKKSHAHHLWLILAAYGVWFAIFSGMEEIVSGKYWKALTSLALGVVVYVVIERLLDKK